MKKWIIYVISFGVIAFLFWHFAAPLENFSQNVPQVITNFGNTQLAQEIQKGAANIVAPPPLRNAKEHDSANAVLTRVGVIVQTNIQRNQNGQLPALKENSLLDSSASAKLKDMFQQQYFEHVNPQGRGPGDLAKTAGYDYIIIGENLALGNFADDKVLVDAWMNSPGHRANILNSKYEEIGVAVGQGMYQGQQTWLAVQEFGRPASSCPSVDANLKSQINTLQSEADKLLPQIQALKTELAQSNPKTQSEVDAYNQKVADYNNLIKEYNNKVDSLKLISTQYNAEVSAYNACLGS